MNLSIQQLLDETLKPKEKKQRSGKWSPSSFGRCFRYQYWHRMDLPPTNLPDARTLRVFKAGELFHDFVQNRIIETHPDVKKEVRVETDDVLGFADLVNDTEVIDLKSQHSRSFWHRTNNQKNIKEEIFQNILQVSWYALQLNKPKIRLVYISKDDLCIQEYSWEVEEFKLDVNRETAALNAFWSRGILPKAHPRAYKGKECNYCNYKDLCEKQEGKKWQNGTQMQEQKTI